MDPQELLGLTGQFSGLKKTLLRADRTWDRDDQIDHGTHQLGKDYHALSNLQRVICIFTETNPSGHSVYSLTNEN